VIGAILIRTEVLRGVDSASASPSEDHHWRGRAGGFGTRSDSLLTRFAERFVEISRERFGLFGTLASGLLRLEGPGTCGPGRVRPPDMHHEAEQHESDQEELVKEQIRCHNDVSSHRHERRRLYRIYPLSNYPLDRGTRPAELALVVKQRIGGWARQCAA
jgi:hypothetical protein